MERNNLIEIWKNVPISGYEQHYQISNLGRIKSLPQIIKHSTYSEKYGGCIRSTKLCGLYLQLCLSVNGKRKDVLIHRLVAMTFVPNPSNKPQVNHIDGVKTNNYAINLEWVTAAENINHSFTVLNRKGNNLGKTGIKAVCNKRIKQYTKNNRFITSYYSLKYAGEMTGIDPTGICKALKNNKYTAGGFIWKYDNEQTLTEHADKIFEVSIRKGISKLKTI